MLYSVKFILISRIINDDDDELRTRLFKFFCYKAHLRCCNWKNDSIITGVFLVVFCCCCCCWFFSFFFHVIVF